MAAVGDDVNALVERVIGAAIEVHRWFGPGFKEATYQRALAVELGLQGMAYELESPVSLVYKNTLVGTGEIDVLVERQLVLELKATDKPPDLYRKQALLYLEATDLHLALIINFGLPRLRDGLARVIR